MDEEAANTVKGFRPGLSSAGEGDRGQRRLWTLCSDGKMRVHVTDVMTTRADGSVRASFVIRASGKSAADKKEGAAAALPRVIPEDWEGLQDDGAADGETANIGFGMTAGGGMTLQLFPHWARHFVSQVLDEGQGLGGQPVFLILDGHASRFSLSAIYFLLANNVFPLCLPSHTSMCAMDPRARPPPCMPPCTPPPPPPCMRARRRGAWPWSAQPTLRQRPTPPPLPARSWSQPNDLGGNASFKWVVGDEVLKGGETVAVQKETLAFNHTFRRAFLRWQREQAEELARTGRNAVTSGWDKSGLRGALNRGCAGWAGGIRAFGGVSMLGTAERVAAAAVAAVGGGAEGGAAEGGGGGGGGGGGEGGTAEGGGGGGGGGEGGGAQGGESADGERGAALLPPLLSAAELLERQAADRLVARMVALTPGAGSLNLVSASAPAAAAAAPPLGWSDRNAWHDGGCDLDEASELLETRLGPDTVAELLRVTRTYELGGGWSGASILQLGALAALQLHAHRPRFVLAPALVAAAVYGQLLREHGAAGEATPAAAADLTLALEALLESPNGPAAPDLASVTLVCRALQAYWVPPPAGCKGATICGACAQRAIAARDAQERAERRVLRANHKEYAPGASGFQRAAERFTSLAGPASPTPLALPPVAASPLAPLPLAPAPAAPPLRIDELPEALLSDILLEAARSDPHLPARLDVFFVASRVCKPWQTLMATEAPRLRATLLRERGYVVVPGAGLRPAARARAHRVGDYARLSGVALQPQQNAVVLRRFVRLDEAVEQQELNPGPLSEQRRVEVVQLRGDVLEAGGRALQGVQLAGAPIHATSLLVARAGAKQQRWHTDADAQDQTFSMLFPVDDRQFCIRGLDKPLKLEPGHVLVFAGGLCHAGAERPRGAGDGLCMHAYAGSGITEKILENVFECKKSEGETD